jgi:hypothetical protein
MSYPVASLSFAPTTPSTNRRGRWPVLVVLTLWFALVFWLALNHQFVAPPGTPPLSILGAVLTPIILFGIAYFASATVRELVLTADLSLVTSLHAMRFVGFAFLGFYALGILPGYFAWPAALGDMAIAVTAPWLARGLREQPKLAASKKFIGWNLFGILDFVVAVSMGAIVPLRFPELRRSGGTAPFAILPLSLIPTFLVPFYTIFHLIALIQARHARNQTR